MLIGNNPDCLIAEDDNLSVNEQQRRFVSFYMSYSPIVFAGEKQKMLQNQVSLPKRVAASEALKLN